MEKLENSVMLMHCYLTEKKEGGGVLVHCECGVSRSVMIVACYIIKYYKKSATEAIRIIQSYRSWANPNRYFRKILDQFFVHYS